MQLIITDAWMARRRALHLDGAKLVLVLLASALLVSVVSIGVYHWVLTARIVAAVQAEIDREARAALSSPLPLGAKGDSDAGLAAVHDHGPSGSQPGESGDAVGAFHPQVEAPVPTATAEPQQSIQNEPQGLIASILSPVLRLVSSQNHASSELHLRERLEVMAQRVGQIQARLAQLESLSERVAGLAGVEPPPPATEGGGGALLQPRTLDMTELDAALQAIDSAALNQTDWLTVMESRLYDQKIRQFMVPTESPVPGVALGSRFGWRIDPVNGQRAMHSGLDFPAPTGTPILAAAGGVVVTSDWHSAYGRTVEIDHGNGLVTRYAHASRLHVKKGDLVRRGQHIADVGNTGRSTGPHLHFEVLVSGVAQDPKVFLDAGERLVRQQVTTLAPAAASSPVPPAAPAQGR